MDGASMTVLYDERCGVCAALAAWLRRRAPAIRAAAIGSPVGDALLRDLDHAERYATVHVADAYGRRRSGALAVPPILRELGWGPLAALAEACPTVSEVAYRAVARNRGALSRALRVSRCST
jgi:predicted DCC family thiol-disulfide oxidoreductase YuxK